MTPDLERLAVVGIGKIGLCLALNLARAGYDVLGVDRDEAYVARITARTLRSAEPGVEDALQHGPAIRATTDPAAVREFDPALVFVGVDTTSPGPEGYDPANVDRVIATLAGLGLRRTRTDVAVLSTVPPGYHDRTAAAAQARGLAMSYNPGFVAQGSILRDQVQPDQVLIGETDGDAGDRIAAIHRRMCRNDPAILRMSPLSAEVTKLATNCFLTMKIAFANGIGDLARLVGADPDRVLAGVGADTRIGPRYLSYGYGFGGPCFPRDNRALAHFARTHGWELLQAEATDAMNVRHRDFQVTAYAQAARADAPIEFRSVTYKAGTEMLEESQALEVAVHLARLGHRVLIRDAPAVVDQLRARFGDLFEYAADGDQPSA